MPLGFGRHDGRGEPPSQAGGAPVVTVPDLGRYATGAGWIGPLPDPGFDDTTLDYVRNMIGHLWGSGTSGMPNPKMLAASARYTDIYRGEANGHQFTVANVAVLLVGDYIRSGPGAEHPGSVCSVQLGGRYLLPLLQVGPRNRERYMRLLIEPVPTSNAAFDKQFEVRSGHADYATELVTPMIPTMMSRDDWAFFVEFNQLVCVTSTAFTQTSEVVNLVDTLTKLVASIPPGIGARYGVAALAAAPAPDPDLDTPENRARIKVIMDAMPTEQRRELMTRIRAEGPAVVFRELLG
jgi:hypothetical protein